MEPSAVVLPRVQRLVREIAERFRPERIILFGSHATDTADAGATSTSWW